MNNNFKDIYRKFFSSNNPAMFYIGINIVLFLLINIVGGLASFGSGKSLVTSFVRPYLAFPADISEWPTRFYAIVTYAFFHQDLFHILFNCLWLFWMGNLFLQFLKPKQFHTVYWGGVIIGALAFGAIYNLSPQLGTVGATLIGASAGVMAIFAAITTLIPNYSVRLLLFGDVKLKYILLAYVLLDVWGTTPGSSNIGGNLSHLGGALFGFVYIKLLQKGTDLSAFFERKAKLRVVKTEAPKTNIRPVNQDEIDAILDKISKTGYDKLTTKEKQTLFDASNS
jgi:membrane associated rhomboid family serine protease